MCPKDDYHLTYEFKKYFVITPTIKFNKLSNNFNKNKKGEFGKKVPKNFEFNFRTKQKFLKKMELIRLNKSL